MTTLHLRPEHVTGVAAAADGGVTIDLTDAGARHLVEAAARHATALQDRDTRHATWLRGLSNEDLMELATSRFGGPDPDVVAEATRRMNGMMERLRPTLEAMQSAGLVAKGGS
ncbi:hypothetical protein AB0903_17145 [Streptomyces sp. NPDC048389]|uniref:hypothetical protein n=1 Tax=Streptomyces sp. NPDC048389 TaxID=3154622 RepID=UPI00345575F1